MGSSRIQFLKIASVLACTAGPLLASGFVPPTEGPVAFRRDQLPIDPDTMAKLSGHLTVLAAGMDAETPAARRSAAQMLALAMALDPANGAARKLIEDYVQDDHQPTGDAATLAASRAWIRELMVWLEDPASTDKGRGLANCLEDIVAEPQATKPGAESGAWAGWVPKLSAYETAPVKPEGLAGGPAALPATVVRLTAASVDTLLWKKIKPSGQRAGEGPPAAKWILEPGRISMAATTAAAGSDAAEKPFAIAIGAPDPSWTLADSTAPILAIVKKRFPDLPSGVRIAVGDAEFGESLVAKKSSAVNAATAVLAISALSGRAPDGTVLGTLDAKGAFGISADFWDELRALASGPGGRLVVPAGAIAYLPSMLAMENPDFFMKYEVLVAKDVEELLEFSSKVPAEPLAGISARFAEIRGKMGSQAAGPFVANPFVRRRLAELSQEAPYHFSAKMLALQGAGQRPTQIPTWVLVPEILRAIEPMEWMLKPETMTSEVNPTDLAATYEACRSQVVRLKRYVQRDDAALLARVEDMVVLIRPLERAMRSRGSEQAGTFLPAHGTWMRAHAAIMEELNATRKLSKP